MQFRSTCLAVTALAGLAGLTGQAFAQSKPAAAPAAAAPAPAAGQQPQGPVKLDLISTGSDWVKVCGQDSGNGKKICYTTRDFSTAADQPPAIALAVYDVTGDDSRVFRLLTPVGLLIKPGFRYSVDKGAQVDGQFEICMPNGCFAETRIKGPQVDALKKGTTLNVAFKNSANNEVTFTMPLAGFGKAFDGAAIDPKVLQAKQEQMQQDLQKQLEAKAQAQRQQLEQSGAAKPATPAAPAAAAPAAK
ncbi:invasion associated locus B family protein [Lichenihabitans sp. Uapishka_5]|uniref:invasion associated locus B family protein n=1 Tax=Lichenihabitans sp. Uapishka_5 TaxID=3037302 RepID=UPI0029E7FDEA|nr:invasion associated locus B family protein [Lichenihabitans sp. Uapishka_5]MDX7950997.1 invasion associated locus B family protein [Lichenihabitans sp. Uapishka_5]